MTIEDTDNKRSLRYTRVVRNLEENDTIMIAGVDHVSSSQFQSVRRELRDKATIIKGKNTMFRSAILKNPSLNSRCKHILPYLKDNIALIICHEDPASVRKHILANRVPASAKQGVIAPCDVFVPPGPTGMDPTQTSFFQALGVSTKIFKGEIEIQSEVQMVKAGEKVSVSAATLLKKLNIRPFTYGIQPKHIIEGQDIYSPDVLDCDQDYIMGRIRSCAMNIAAIGRATYVPNTASVQYSLIQAAKNVMALALSTDREIVLLQNLSGPANVSQAAPVESKTEESTPVQEEEEEESDGDIGFSLFD